MLENIRDELLVPQNEGLGMYKDSVYKIKDQMSNKPKSVIRIIIFVVVFVTI